MLKVLFFASLREELATRELELSLHGPLTVAELKQQLALTSPVWLRQLCQRQILQAVNQQLVGLDHPLQQGDEVAFFPMVTGG
ncbi:MoaD/ThiS family protein [Rheinheimera soli]|uniref:Molybdopterin synthase sulfur carrier subunit n=1 Tax=Rheinheimera soli TaxID=443616 RepID=A0ABU1W3Q2_9GAMM|nr:MoaD/ThiS family protein [Rheinheimera soli]MDR7122343.1 molybdopterin synthase sulfur carrier subunit [Rheinheimera soli]